MQTLRWLEERGRVTFLQWTAILAVTAFLILSIWAFGPPHYTLEPTYSDHLKHEYDSWAFTQVGFLVFSEPVASWHVDALHEHQLWEFAPHMYPIGAIFTFLPFGAMSNSGLIPDNAVHLLMSLSLAVGSVAALAMFWQTVRPMRLFLTLLVGVSYLHWGLNGFYDATIAGMAIYGIDNYRKEEYGKALVSLTAALSLHYRGWYLAPVLLAVAWRWWRGHGLDWRLGIATLLGSTSLLTFFLSLQSTELLREGDVPSLPDSLGGAAILALTLSLVGLGVVVATERSFVTTSTLALAVLMVAFVPQVHAWYPVLLTPLFVLIEQVRSQAIMAIVYLQFAYIAGFPSLIRLVDFYVQAVL